MSPVAGVDQHRPFHDAIHMSALWREGLHRDHALPAVPRVGSDQEEADGYCPRTCWWVSVLESSVHSLLGVVLQTSMEVVSRPVRRGVNRRKLDGLVSFKTFCLSSEKHLQFQKNLGGGAKRASTSVRLNLESVIQMFGEGRHGTFCSVCAAGVDNAQTVRMSVGRKEILITFRVSSVSLLLSETDV